jgi:hypothetical protein
VKRRATLLVAVVLGCFLAAGCGDKKSKEAAAGPAGGAAAEAVQEVKPAVWGGDYDCKNGDAECRDDKIGGDGFYFNGTVFQTNINTDVTVRATPTKNGESMLTAKKDTKVIVLGVSKEGWVNISVKDVVPKRGWVYGQYVDFKEGVNFGGLKPIDMKITDFNFTAKDSSTADLTATCEINGTARTLKLSAFKDKGQKFFTFFCDAYVEGSHYTLSPGLYTWDFTKNQLKLTVSLTRNPYSYNDAILLWKKARFTDDKKFFVIGDKAEDGLKAAFRASDQKLLFDWNFSKGCDNTLSFNFKNNTATFACPADAVMAKSYTGLEEMDGAVADYGSSYVEDNPQPNPASSLEVICDVNLETGSRKITSGKWTACE